MAEGSSGDVLYGFDWFGMSEPIRMMYFIKGAEYENHRISWGDWESKYKKEMPLEALPVLKTGDGIINQSTTIARHAARKLGLMGNDDWEETLHDMVQENITEVTNYERFLYFKSNGWLATEPPKSLEETKEFCLKVVKLVQTVAERRGRTYIVGDQIGLAEIWLYTELQLWKRTITDITDSSDWLAAFEKKFESESQVKQYLEQRGPGQ